MSKLIMMVGIPGSGKSTWIKNNKTESELWVSRDKIRFDKLKEGEEDFSHENAVFEQFIEEIIWGLEMDKTVIADATHLNEASRKKVLDKVRKFADETEAIVMDVHLITALERNDKREGLARVPRGVVRRMYFQMQAPTKEEGFNKITFIREDEE